MINIREYQDVSGHSPFHRWFEDLNSDAARKVMTALYRIGLGNLSSVKSVGGGVYESRINFGPGYRIYFGRDGDTVVVLLGGGTKHRQRNDIAHALKRWTDYKQRKNQQKEEK